MRPRIAFAAIELLEANGCEVVVPSAQTCCGQPAWNSGDRNAARALAEKLIAEFEGCEYVVVPSGSCAGMVRKHYRDIFPDDGAWLERAERLAARTYELTDFLVNVLHAQNVTGNYPGSVTYHDSCSGLRELGVKVQPRALLAKLPQLRLVEMKDSESCCGFGGAFSVKFGEISSSIADSKCERIAECGADAAVLGDLGCMLHIEGRLRRRGDMKTRVLHVAEVLTWKR